MNQIFFCILQFTDDADSVGGNSLESLTAKDLTKYVYGVAKGMEYIVSKGVRKDTLLGDIMNSTMRFGNCYLRVSQMVPARPLCNMLL